ACASAWDSTHVRRLQRDHGAAIVAAGKPTVDSVMGVRAVAGTRAAYHLSLSLPALSRQSSRCAPKGLRNFRNWRNRAGPERALLAPCPVGRKNSIREASL